MELAGERWDSIPAEGDALLLGTDGMAVAVRVTGVELASSCTACGVQGPVLATEYVRGKMTIKTSRWRTLDTATECR